MEASHVKGSDHFDDFENLTHLAKVRRIAKLAEHMVNSHVEGFNQLGFLEI